MSKTELLHEIISTLSEIKKDANSDNFINKRYLSYQITWVVKYLFMLIDMQEREV